MSAENTSPDRDEPSTPTWFTVLGIAIFLFGGIFALVASQGEPEATVEPGAEDPTAAQEGAAVAAQPGTDAQPGAAAQPRAAAPDMAPTPTDPSDPHAGHGH